MPDRKPAAFQTLPFKSLPYAASRTPCHDEFQRRCNECRRLAAAARTRIDREFWLELVQRWQALASQSPHPLLLRRRKAGARREPHAAIAAS